MADNSYKIKITAKAIEVTRGFLWGYKSNYSFAFNVKAIQFIVNLN